MASRNILPRLMNRMLCCLCGVLLFGFFPGCDFPPSPPLKSADSISPDPSVLIDSARSLLPLKPGNRWTYVVIPDMGPPQMAVQTGSTEVMYLGEVYYDLRYAYLEKPAASLIHAFPPLLQVFRHGLHFFDRGVPHDTTSLSRPPKFLFTLPYPASVGTVFKDPRSEISVNVVSKDTLVRGWNNIGAFRCYRYDIRLGNTSRYSIYVVPGSALYKIVFETLTFYTISWRVD